MFSKIIGTLSTSKIQATQCLSSSAFMLKSVKPDGDSSPWLKRILCPHCCDQNFTSDASDWVSCNNVQCACCPLQNREAAFLLSDTLKGTYHRSCTACARMFSADFSFVLLCTGTTVFYIFHCSGLLSCTYFLWWVYPLVSPCLLLSSHSPQSWPVPT